ncbi:acyl carrier protein [Micromonospora sp. NBC_01699]|uniref:acyl carrier protein n=1 Tax=Micromonospora sp. NBC_01699 TaxID=2975984 RepID=UPI002E28499D|nr:acyl carrier protein [Micromonospora sp. NBC_01699]
MSDVTGTVVGLVERVTESPDISPASSFHSLADWTSLAALRLLTEIEDEFGVQLDLRTYLAVNDVGQLSDLVSTALGDR